jgi:hypothetical protein
MVHQFNVLTVEAQGWWADVLAEQVIGVEYIEVRFRYLYRASRDVIVNLI